MTNKNVLLISSNSSSRGGGEKYLIYLALGLRDKGFNVSVLLSESSYMDSWNGELIKLDFKVYRFKLKALKDRKLRFIEAVFDFKQIFNISNFCRKLNPKFIVVNQQYDEDGLDYVQGSILSGNKNVIGIIHMPMTKGKNLRPFGKWRGVFLNFWYKFFNYKKVFVSNGSRDEFISYYKSVKNIFVINNSITKDANINYSLLINKKNKKYINITFIGQFVKQKNLIGLINIWNKLRNDGLDIRLILIGDGPLKSEIIRKLKCENSKYWKVYGWVSSFNNLLEKTDIYVMPSKFEGLPLSLLEVASKGIYCVVNPFNGANDVSKFANWVKVAKSFDSKDFFKLLKNIIINKTYQQEIEDKKLLKFNKYFSLERMTNQILELIDND